MVRLATFPYYRFYHFNTVKPIRSIGVLVTEEKWSRARASLAGWRARKLEELQFISIASTVLAGAVIGSFSWDYVFEAYWLGQALWFASLILSVLAILLAAQQITVLHYLEPLDVHADQVKSQSEIKAQIRRYLPLMLTKDKPAVARGRSESTGAEYWISRRKMIFIWQCPVMFMSYSVCMYLLGLTLYVCTPLIRKGTEGQWTTGCSIAVIYLGVFATTGAAFMLCSFWIYHYIEAEIEAETPTPTLGAEQKDEESIAC